MLHYGIMWYWYNGYHDALPWHRFEFDSRIPHFNIMKDMFQFMKDGLYQVTYKGICAGFVVKNNKVEMGAPILRAKFPFWQKIAVYINA